MKKASVLLVAGALAMFGLAACGSDSNSDSSSDTTAAVDTTATQTTGGGGGAATVDISAAADGSLAYDQTSVDTTAGSVDVSFDNPSPLGHDVVIADSSGKEIGSTDVISQSSTSTTVDLQPGTYTFFCSVDGHRAAGMEGTINVK